MSVKLAHAIQSVKQWNKSAKEVMGTILFLLKKLISFWKKEQQNIPTRKRDDLVMSVVNNRGVWVAKPSSYNIGWNTI